MAKMANMVKMAEMAMGQPKNHFIPTHKSHDIILLTVSGDRRGYKKAQILLKKSPKSNSFQQTLSKLCTSLPLLNAKLSICFSNREFF